MDIIGKFTNGTISVSNMKFYGDREYIYECDCDITVTTPLYSITCHFIKLEFFYDDLSIQPENNVFLIEYEATTSTIKYGAQQFKIYSTNLLVNKKGIEIKSEQNGLQTQLFLEFDDRDDQETLNSFLIELSAYYEHLQEEYYSKMNG